MHYDNNRRGIGTSQSLQIQPPSLLARWLRLVFGIRHRTMTQPASTSRGSSLCMTPQLPRYRDIDMPSWDEFIIIQSNLSKWILLTPPRPHTPLTAHCPGLPGWAGTRKVNLTKPVWILLKQETVAWAICKSAPHSRQITTPATHHSVFLQAGCPSCRPTNSVRALKAITA